MVMIKRDGSVWNGDKRRALRPPESGGKEV
jgi:hypothetical protein